MKQIKKYLIIWISMVSLFNLISFITPDEWHGIRKYTGAFWVGYAFIMVAFVIHLSYAFFASSERGKGKQIFQMPLMVLSYFELGLMLLVGSLCMVLPGMPYWLSVILCYAILALSVIFMVSASTASEVKTEGNRNINVKTSKMRYLTDFSEELMLQAKMQETRDMLKSIHETIKYSDMVSSETTMEYETQIEDRLMDIQKMLGDGFDGDSLRQKTDEVLGLIQQRDHKCKEQKRKV